MCRFTWHLVVLTISAALDDYRQHANVYVTRRISLAEFTEAVQGIDAFFLETAAGLPAPETAHSDPVRLMAVNGPVSLGCRAVQGSGGFVHENLVNSTNPGMISCLPRPRSAARGTGRIPGFVIS